MFVETKAKNNTVRFKEEMVLECLKMLQEEKDKTGKVPTERIEPFFFEHTFGSPRTIRNYTRLTLARIKNLA